MTENQVSGRRPEVEERIEDAALRVFSETEFHRVALADIAREAGASLQTLYRYYGGKEALLNACLHRWLGELAERMLDHLAGIETYKDRLRKVFWVVLDFFDRNPRVGWMMIHSVYPDRWGDDVTPAQHRLTQLFLSVLEEGQNYGVLTNRVSGMVLLDFFYGILLRVNQMHLLRRETRPLAEQAPVLFEMVWAAISAEPVPGAEPASLRWP
jgi:AcrR family transcriptional regulator